MKRDEFFVEGKQIKRLLEKLRKSDFAEWLEIVENMIESGESEFNHENETFIHCYNDDNYYQICIISFV